MNANAPVLTARFWRTRRSAAIAGIVFGVLLLTAMVMMRTALHDDSYGAMRSDGDRRQLVHLSLQVIPFAGIAFLWFIGVIREQLGAVEDRLFSTVFLGSGLLFLGLLFSGAVTASSMLLMLGGPNANTDVWAYGLDTPKDSSPSMPCGWQPCSRCRSAPSASALRHFRDGSPTPGT